MAKVQWQIKGSQDVPKIRGMPTPKFAAEIYAWFRSARLAIPDIPDPTAAFARWEVSHSLATVDYVIFELHNRQTGEIGVVTIDRRYNGMGF